jgi:hypothetical protein
MDKWSDVRKSDQIAMLAYCFDLENGKLDKELLKFVNYINFSVYDIPNHALDFEVKNERIDE